MPSYSVDNSDLSFDGEVSGENFERLIANIKSSAVLSAEQIKQVAGDILALIPTGCEITMKLIEDIITGVTSAPGTPDVSLATSLPTSQLQPQ